MTSPSRVSIALCTYNGAAHLQEQLASLVLQTRLPDELIVCDDASADDTVDILRRFSSDAPFPTIVHVNERNLGFIANFEQAVALATGDIIALCDQDDIWLPEKLASMEAVFERRPEVGLVFSDGDVVDDELRPLGTTLFEYASFTPARRRQVRKGDAFDVLLDANVVTGAAMAFRASLRALALPIPQGTGRFHDSWLAVIASAVMGVEFLPERLILYRQHEAQVTGIRKSDRAVLLDQDHYRRHAEYLELIDTRLALGQSGDRLEESTSPGPSSRGELTKRDSRRRLAARLAHVKARADMPAGAFQRLPIVVREMFSGRYTKYSNGMRSVLRDLFAR